MTIDEVKNTIISGEYGDEFTDYIRFGYGKPKEIGDHVITKVKEYKNSSTEEYWIVFGVGDQHFKIPGFASSYGTEYDELEYHNVFEVKPVEKTYIDWEAV